MSYRLRIAVLTLIFSLLQLTLGGLSGSADEVSGGEIAVTETIQLASGDTLTGAIVSRDDAGVVMDHPVLGRITIPYSEIAVETPEPVTPGLFGTEFLRGATRTIGLGFSGASGNTQNMGMSATLRIAKETDRHRGNFASVYLYNSESGDQTQNQFYTRYVHDFLFPGSKFFLYANGRYDFDEFRDWDHRIAAAAGGGYEIFKDDRFDLLGRLGFGFSRNFGSTASSDDDVVPEMQVGLEFAWRITEGMSFELRDAYMPDLGDIAEFRNLTNVGYKIDVGIVKGLAFRFGFENEYISNSATKKNDLKYLGNLTYDL